MAASASSWTKSVVLLTPPALFAGTWIAQRLVSSRRRATPMSKAASATVTLASGALALGALASLSDANTEIMPEHPERSTVLVTDGAYAISRNPIYVALAGILAGHAILRRSLPALGLVCAFVAAINRRQIPAEEHALRSHFGRRYRAYESTTPRWLGRPQGK